MIASVDILTLLGIFVGLLIGIISAGVILILLTASMPDLTQYESEKYFYDPSNEQKKEEFPSIDDAPSKSLSVIVPAYNEEQRLPVMMDEALTYLEKRQKEDSLFTYEVIVVNDGSKDSTTEVAWKYSSKYGTDKVRVLTLQKNRGKGGAVRQGILRGRGSSLLFADADGATTFADISKLEKAMDDINTQSSGMAVVCGSRAHLEKESIAERSLFRTILMIGFNFLVWLLCVRGIKDTQCGFKLFSRPAAQLLFRNMHVERWAFDVDILHLAQRFSIPMAEVSVKWQEIEGSKLSPLQAAIQMFKDMFRIRLSYMTGAWRVEEYKPKSQ